jgi:hypothetical protein
MGWDRALGTSLPASRCTDFDVDHTHSLNLETCHLGTLGFVQRPFGGVLGRPVEARAGLVQPRSQ